MEFSLSKVKENGNGGETALVPAALTLEEVKPSFDEYLERVSLFEKSAEALEVKDDETREQAANLAAGAKKIVKAINNRKLEVTAQARNFTSSVNGFVDKFVARLTSVAKIAGGKELAYINLQEMKRREQERLAQEAAAKLQKQIDKEAKREHIEPIQVAAPVVSEVQTTARTESGVTSYTTKKWVGDVFDPDRVERKFCSPDQGKINAEIKNGVRQMSGVNIYEKEDIRHRG